MLINKLALVFGLVCLALTYVASMLGNVLQAALSLFGMIGGPLLGVFSLGMFFPWANKWGAYVGLFGTLILMFWIGVGAAIVKPPLEKALTSIEYCNLSAFSNSTVTAMFTPTVSQVVHRGLDYPLYTLSYMWYSTTAVMSCIVIGLAVSFATGATKPKDVDPRLICPLFDILFPFLPERVLKPLRFGIIHEGKYEKRAEKIRDGSVISETIVGVKKSDEVGVKKSDEANGAYDNMALAHDTYRGNSISTRV